jgi:hypothetical protein
MVVMVKLGLLVMGQTQWKHSISEALSTTLLVAAVKSPARPKRTALISDGVNGVLVSAIQHNAPVFHALRLSHQMT